MAQESIWVFLDNEGPQTKNDNAQEITVALARLCGLGKYIGIDFYHRISVIDDIWGDFHRIPKDPDYSSGYTLKVILPFLKAMGATSKWFYDFSKTDIKVVPNIVDVMRSLDQEYNVRQVSTSYDFFIKAYCDLIGFDFAKSVCTKVPVFDTVSISKEDSDVLKSFMKKVAKSPVIDYDAKTGEVSGSCERDYQYITGFIWQFVYGLEAGSFLRTVHPVGQKQKQEVLADVSQKYMVSKEKMFYVGDSQTDVKCVQYIKGEGLSMMFNGKGLVCDDSDLMYIGEDAGIIEKVADLFAQHGRDWVIRHFTPLRRAYGGEIAAVTSGNIEELKEKSLKKRKEFRGASIAELT